MPQTPAHFLALVALQLLHLNQLFLRPVGFAFLRSLKSHCRSQPALSSPIYVVVSTQPQASGTALDY